ncbi:MAG: tripartite tricarboxylate transporter substrate binding protein [Alphaproteobacteria bacterium]|nr:tripartite tricarboxylate transporter substrate binding protein [Alphaproteobacteria bacterium]
MALACGLLPFAASVPAAAQDYPNRPIRIVVGFPPGGGVDSTARVMAAEMSKHLGQSMVVENKPGAAGTLGAADVARSAPDGYTIMVTPGGHAIFGAMFKSLPFDTVKSFDWISNIVTLSFFVMVPANSEFKTLADLVAKAKAEPGKLTYGSAGPGSTHHLGIELLGARAGAKFLHVPYRGDAPVITALLGSEVQFALATPTQAISNAKAGKLRAIAVAANSRHPALPDVPTVEQALGIQNYDVRTWFAMAGPAGMPKPVVDRLNAEVRKAVAVPEVRARLTGSGGEPAAGTSDAMRERVARELATWTKTVEDAGVPKN